jgi:hypothetical protein
MLLSLHDACHERCRQRENYPTAEDLTHIDHRPRSIRAALEGVTYVILFEAP